MDDMDRAQDRQAEFTADALRDHWRKQTFGIGLSHCRKCGEQIPEQRRKAVPTATHCIDCQTGIEFNSRRPL